MTEPTPPEETTLHPDDSASLSSVEVFSGTADQTSERLYRVGKIELNGGGGVRTQYSFRRTKEEDSKQVLIEVAHGDTANGDKKPPASIADLTISRKVGEELRILPDPTEMQVKRPGIDRPQTWYTYEDTASGEAFTVVIYQPR